MSLSNVAVPATYAKYRDKVRNRKLLICETIRLQFDRIEQKIADPGLYYDPDVVDGWIKFCETELTLTDGEPVKLLDSFKLWAEDALGWYYFVTITSYVPPSRNHNSSNQTGKHIQRRIKKRLTNEQYIIIPRSNAKSMYSSYMQAYFLVTECSTNKQAATAPTVKQADEVMGPFKTAIKRRRGPVIEWMNTCITRQNASGSNVVVEQLVSTKKGIENKITGSIIEVVPMSVDSFQGPRYKIVTIDEWLSCDIREDVTTAAKQCCSKLPDHLIIETSSEGLVRNGPGDNKKMELMKILKGEYDNDHVSIFWYQQDNINEVNDERLWIKSNPNLGITVSYETLALDLDRAEASPSTRNDTLAKRFGIPLEGYTYFFTYEETKLHSKTSFKGMSCALGVDLSQGNDFCAFTFLFPLRNGLYGIKARSYISEVTYKKLIPALRVKYDEFIKEGSLIIMNGTILDIDEVYDELADYIDDMDYDVLCMGYDPYGADKFLSRWTHDYGSYCITQVRQGARTESIPLGEIKKMSEEGILLFDQKIMSFTMGNCIVIQDTNGNMKLSKRRYDQKIDNVSGLLDAWVSLKEHKEAF